jgi:hypothetical protein
MIDGGVRPLITPTQEDAPPVYPPPAADIIPALVFASRNNSFISPMSAGRISFRPDKDATMLAGVINWSAYLAEKSEPGRFKSKQNEP